MEWQPHLKKKLWTMQERGLTSPHSFLDANPLALLSQFELLTPWMATETARLEP